MSYCAGVPDFANPPGPGNPGSDWISARGWQQALRCVQSVPAVGCPANQDHPAASAASARSGAPAGSASARAGVALHGSTISFIGYLKSDGKVLSPALMPTTGGAAGARHSRYVATLVGASGRIISREPLSGQRVHIEASRGHRLVVLTALQGFLPTHGRAVAGLILRARGRVVAHIRAPRHQPRVQVRRPRFRRGSGSFTLHWRTRDPDRGRRTTFIDVSTDGGHHFTTIWVGFDRGRATLPVAALRGSRRARVRVRVSDGFHTGTGTVRFAAPAVRRALRVVQTPAWQRELQAIGIRVLPAP